MKDNGVLGLPSLHTGDGAHRLVSTAELSKASGLDAQCSRESCPPNPRRLSTSTSTRLSHSPSSSGVRNSLSCEGLSTTTTTLYQRKSTDEKQKGLSTHHSMGDRESSSSSSSGDSHSDGSFSSSVTSDAETRGLDGLFFRVIDVEAAAAAAAAHGQAMPTALYRNAEWNERYKCLSMSGGAEALNRQTIPVYRPRATPTTGVAPLHSPSCTDDDDWSSFDVSAPTLRGSPPPQELETLRQLQEAGRQAQQRHLQDHRHHRKHPNGQQRRSQESADATALSLTEVQSSLHGVELTSSVPASVSAVDDHAQAQVLPQSHPLKLSTSAGRTRCHRRLDTSGTGGEPTTHAPHSTTTWTTTHTGRAPVRPLPHRVRTESLMRSATSVGELRTRSHSYAIHGHDSETGLLRTSNVVEVEELHSTVRRPFALLEQVSCEGSHSARVTATPSGARSPQPHVDGGSQRTLRSTAVRASAATPGRAGCSAATMPRGLRRRQIVHVDEDDDDDDDDNNGFRAWPAPATDLSVSAQFAQSQPSIQLRREAEARFSATFSGVPSGCRLPSHANRSTTHSSKHTRIVSSASATASLHAPPSAPDGDDSPLVHAPRWAKCATLTTSPPIALLANMPVLDISDLLTRHSSSANGGGLRKGGAATCCAGAAGAATSAGNADIVSPLSSEPHSTLLTPEMPSIALLSPLNSVSGMSTGDCAFAACASPTRPGGPAVSPVTLPHALTHNAYTEAPSGRGDGRDRCCHDSPDVQPSRHGGPTPETTSLRVSDPPLMPDEVVAEGDDSSRRDLHAGRPCCTTPLATSANFPTAPQTLDVETVDPFPHASPPRPAEAYTAASDLVHPNPSSTSRRWPIPSPPSLPLSVAAAASAPWARGGSTPFTPASHSLAAATTSQPSLYRTGRQAVSTGSLSDCSAASHGASPRQPGVPEEEAAATAVSMGLSLSGTAQAPARQEMVLPSAAGQLLRFTPVDLSGSVRLLNVSHCSNSSPAASFSSPSTPPRTGAFRPSPCLSHEDGTPLSCGTAHPVLSATTSVSAANSPSGHLTSVTSADAGGTCLSLRCDQSPLAVPLDMDDSVADDSCVVHPSPFVLDSAITVVAGSGNLLRPAHDEHTSTLCADGKKPSPAHMAASSSSWLTPISTPAMLPSATGSPGAGAASLVPGSAVTRALSSDGPLSSVDSDPLCAGDVDATDGRRKGTIQWVRSAPSSADTSTSSPSVAAWPGDSLTGAPSSVMCVSPADKASDNPLSPDDEDS